MKDHESEIAMYLVLMFIGGIIFICLSVTLGMQKEAEREITTYSDGSEDVGSYSVTTYGCYSSGSYTPTSSSEDIEEYKDLDGSYDEDSGDYQDVIKKMVHG